MRYREVYWIEVALDVILYRAVLYTGNKHLFCLKSEKLFLLDKRILTFGGS